MPETVAALSRADISLGRLSGLGLLVNEPELLLGPSMALEALESSRIEGTQASLSDVLSSENEDHVIEDDNLREVINYLRAAREGVDLLEKLPITRRFICDLHETLMKDVRGDEKYPGEIRREPVWIGSPNDRPETAKFIPPHHDHIADLLGDWEKFVNEPSSMPPVMKCALLHYQFETIHPFLDGNGRIGRLLIGFSLMQGQVLSGPILHISGYFEQHRDEYYERLQNVRERGQMEEWIQFFSEAVTIQANESAKRIQALVEIRERYRSETSRDRSTLPALIDLIFKNPLLTVSSVMKFANISQPTASVLLRKAQERGWLQSAGRWGRGGKERWIAREIWSAVTNDKETVEP
ncbi:MAG: Fic family protein [Actinomycetales bacterium]|nr:Fic family protein [Actinomycetales bacterium]